MGWKVDFVVRRFYARLGKTLAHPFIYGVEVEGNEYTASVLKFALIRKTPII